MNLRTTFAAALAFLALSSAAMAQTVFTSNTTITDTDFSFEGQDIIIRGCTVTINGAHSFNSLIVERNVSNVAGVLTHSAAFDNGTVKGVFLTIANGCFIEGANGNLVGSRIDAAGRGHPGGTGPGAGGNAAQAAGGGHGGYGGTGNPAAAAPGGVDYDLAYQPTLFGSGGGNDSNSGVTGASGGGLIRLTVGGALTVNGTLTANGANGSALPTEPGAGAGGTLRLNVGSLAGTGTISASGGNADQSWSGGGGGGRIAIFTDVSTFSGTLTACGGDGRFDGGAGTIFTKTSSQSYGSLLVSNCSLALATITTLPGDTLVYDAMTIENSATVTLPGFSTLSVGTLTIGAGGDLNHLAGQAGFTVNAGACTIAAGGKLDLTGRGFANASGPGAGGNGTEAGGAGHGGNGAPGNTAAGGTFYGSIVQPSTLGSGGGNDSNSLAPGGFGGGALRMTVTGTLTVDGSLLALGASPISGTEPGAGAGGSLWLTVGALAGSGSISTNGGAANPSWSGGGGGGRIAIYTNANSFAGAITACGGNGRTDGGPGTILTKSSAQSVGSLLIDNCTHNVPVTTDLPTGEDSFDSITLAHNAILDVAAPLTLDVGTFSVETGATFTHHAGQAGLTVNVTQNMTIDGASAVNLTGRGFAGQNGPGTGSNGTEAGGGAYGGYGGAGNTAGGGIGYGTTTEPLDLGSGGGRDTNGNINGSNGGGALHLTVGGTLSVAGSLNANGANSVGLPLEPGAGSGGSLWLAVGALAGNGAITANGGAANQTWSGGGGGGRIALYTNSNGFTGTLTACGGNGRNDGGAGSIYTKSSSQTLGSLFLYNCANNTSAITDLPVGETSFNTMAISGAAILDTPAPRTIDVDDLTITTGSTLTHRAGQAGLHVISNGNVLIDATSAINLTGRGFASQLGLAPGGNGTEAGGGGYGGFGGAGNTAAGGATYGSIPLPIDLGSGGGRDTNAGIFGSNGGGAITLEAAGTLTVQGLLTVNGAPSNFFSFEPGAGSGGSLQLIVGALAGTGAITANGGDANPTWSGGGGGGRIALYTDVESFTGTLTACGGNGRNDGGAGTIYRKTSTQDFGTVLFANCGHNLPSISDLAGHTDFDALTIRDNAILDLPAPQNIYAGSVEIGAGSTLTHRAAQQGLQLFCASLNVQTGGSINLNGRGHPGSTGPGAGGNGTVAGGAGHGGTGGSSNGGGGGGGPYDSLVNPTQLGSGGGRDTNANINGSSGGGAIFIGCAGNTIVDGSITANGANSNTFSFEPGAGSGGSIWIVTNGLAGSGLITTRGGNANGTWSGGGAGGRISITSSNRTMPVAAIIAPGGTGFQAGDCGSVYLSQPGCTGNYDGNCETNSNDVTAYLDQWFADQANNTLYADINHDGETNSNDVTFFLNAWFAALSGAC